MLNVIYVYFDILHIQGQIQDFLIGGSNLQKGVDLLNVPEYLLFFPDFSEYYP